MYSSVIANNNFDDDTTKNKNAFSLAEKKYQLKVIETIRVDMKTRRRRKGRKLVEEIDLSETIDFDEFVGKYESSSVMRVRSLRRRKKKQTFKAKEESKRWRLSLVSDNAIEERPRVWKLLDHPGAYYVQNVEFTRAEELIVMHCVSPERPNKTNHWQRLGKPLRFVEAAKADLYLNEEGKRVDGVEKPPKRGDGMESRAARHLLRKLRWATVGAPFRWTKRVYEEERAPEVDERIKRACVRALEIVFGKEAAFVAEKGEENSSMGKSGWQISALPGRHFKRSRGQRGARLEQTNRLAFARFAAIFLLRQKSKALKPVTALIVRSGDAISCSTGESQTMFHDVPESLATTKR